VAWAPPHTPYIESDPSDNLYIKGLPTDSTQESVREIFGAYGAVVSCKLMSHPNEASALLRMGNVDMASWIVENLNGNIPQGLEKSIMVKFADTPLSKARKMQAAKGAPVAPVDPSFGPAPGGKGIGFEGSPYGDAGGAVQFGNFDTNLPEDVQQAVDAVIMNMGGGGKKMIAPSGDLSNLYVKDLPGAADELYIFKLFSPFGAIESITIKKGEANSWAIAFVKFFSNEEAANAITGLTNCYLPDGTMPKVSVKVSK
jgi:RNA recognition motif-containing protein